MTTFSAVFVWCAFQTGNTLQVCPFSLYIVLVLIRSRGSIPAVQLGLALARLFGPSNDTSFHIPDRQALTSLTTFLFGAFLGRIGDRLGPRSRLWLVLGTFMQALMSMAAAIALWKSGQGSVADDRGDPSWTNALTYVAIGFVSASMGLQGIMGKRVNTQFATTSTLRSSPFV